MAEDSDTFKSSTLARSEYNTIAESYSEVVPALPFTIHVEEHTSKKTLQGLISSGRFGSARIPRALDLACGNGRYTRNVKFHWGVVDQVLGVDISPEMVAQANAATKKFNDPNITFEVGDGSSGEKFYTHPGQGGVPYDLVVAAYLLNHASTRENLLAFCKTVYANLDPEHGVFLTANNSPFQPPNTFQEMAKYGFTKRFGPEVDTTKPVPDFTPFTLGFFTNPADPSAGVFELTDHFMGAEPLVSCLKEAGFKSVRFVQLEAAEQKEFFQDFIDWQVLVVIEALV